MDDYSLARQMAQLFVKKKRQDSGGTLTVQMIEDAVDSSLLSLPKDSVDKVALIADLEASFQTFVGKARALQSSDTYKPWVKKGHADINWAFWRRYASHLLDSGWPQPTIDKVDEFTDMILDFQTEPTTDGAWDRRGLVVGHVQSGKTANYTGLICKAADAGYKVIVVLAGMHKSLRTQTQVRLEEGFLGYETFTGKSAKPVRTPIGVGTLDPEPKANTVTTRADNGDFRKQFAKQLGFGLPSKGAPLLFVIKKNGSVLRNLVEWVSSMANRTDENGRRFVANVPLLVVDDEADQGSIDTKAKDRDENGEVDEDHDPTVLNRRIRELLQIFDQSAYVAYTATPFANVLIHDGDNQKQHGDDLFPKDYIVSLPAPSNYVGPVRVFGLSEEGREGLPIIRVVKDHGLADEEGEAGWMPTKHNKHHLPLIDGREELPTSLQTAIASFVLVCATRVARGDATKHNSMLIHVTRFTAVQGRVTAQVKNAVASLKNGLLYGPQDTLLQLKELWDEDFVPSSRTIAADDCDEVSWEEVKEHLVAAVTSISVKEINGAAGDILDYESNKQDGLNVIAVGGDKLSRGLTLEGLSVSYFLRASRMYDTLMQMGRWFGYRPRYVDLCRIYTTGDLVEWFEHITKANEELRDEFNIMSAAHQTPREYGQRVIAHPDLLVTSQVKMRDGQKLDLTFAGDISETIAFHRAKNIVRSNFEALQGLVHDSGGIENAVKKTPRGTDVQGSKLLWLGVSARAVVSFLDAYRAHQNARKVKPQLLSQYIKMLNAEGELMDWSIAILGGNEGENSHLNDLLGGRLRPSLRSWHGKWLEEDVASGVFRIRRLVSPNDEWLDLTQAEFDQAKATTAAGFTEDGGRQESKATRREVSGPSIRAARDIKRGLLMVYPLAPVVATSKVWPTDEGDEGPPLTGIALSFPKPKNFKTVSYVVNNVYSNQEFGA